MATLVYIDETGTQSKQPLLTVAAVLVPEERVQPLSKELRGLATTALGGITTVIEFHGNELWGGGGPWTGLPPSALIATYEHAIDLLDQLNISVAHATIDKPKLYARYSSPDSPYLLALQFLCHKIGTGGARKVLIADRKKEEELRAIEMVTDLQSVGSGIVSGPPLPAIIDSLHYVDSHKSPGVQLADLVAFVLQRFRNANDKHPDSAAAIARLHEKVWAATVTWREPWPS